MSAFADFQDSETISGNWPPPKDKVLSIDVPVQLTDRRIYFYAEVRQSVAGQPMSLIAEIQLFRNNSTIAVYPVEIGINTQGAQTPQNRSYRCLANAGGSPVGDCLTLVLNSAFTTSSLNAILQPIRMSGQIDRVQVNIKDYSGASNNGWRAYIACLSQSAS